MYPIGSLALTFAVTLTAAAEPDPQVILRSAVERVQHVNVAAGRIESRSLTRRDGEDDRRWSLDAAVMLRRMADGSDLGWAIAYESTIESTREGQSGTFAVTYDGERLMIAEKAARSAFIVEREQGAADFLTSRKAGHTAAAWFREFSSAGYEVAFNRDIVRSLRHLGMRERDGVECDVVEYVAEMGGFEATGTWYIGRDDGVLRRYHEVSRKLDGSWSMDSESNYVDVRTNEAVGELPLGAFAITLPEGFEQVAYVPARPPSLRPGAKAPAFSAKDATGRIRTLDEFRGKVVVLDFWATWCLPCRRAMPVMQAMHEQWGEEGLEMIGVSCWERGGDPIGYFTEQSFTYTSLIEGDEVARDYRISALPTVIVIGRNGRILFVESGWGEFKEQRLRSVIEGALQEASPAAERSAFSATKSRLTGGYSLFYPSTDYVTASGSRLEGTGVVPDVSWTAPRRIDSEMTDPAWIFARDHLREFEVD